jgi:hypothetical protein
LAVAAACAASIAMPTERDAAWAAREWPGIRLADLRHGRHLYLHYCDGCHELVLPHQRTTAQWPADLRRMERHVRIPEADAKYVERYILSIRARQK